MTFWLNGRTLYAIITSKARCAFEFFIHFNLSGLCTVSAVPKCRRSFLQQEQQPSAVGATHKTALMLSFAAPVVYVIITSKARCAFENIETLLCFAAPVVYVIIKNKSRGCFLCAPHKMRLRWRFAPTLFYCSGLRLRTLLYFNLSIISMMEVPLWNKIVRLQPVI